MRDVLSLSLPAQATKEIKSLAKKRGFSSVSHYIRTLVESDKEIISEAELLNSIKTSQQEYSSGKTITAKSLAELL